MKKEKLITDITLLQTRAYKDWQERIRAQMDIEVKSLGYPVFTIRFLEYDTLTNVISDHAYANVHATGDVKNNIRNFMIQYPKMLPSSRVLIASSLTFTIHNDINEDGFIVLQILETSLITKKICYRIVGQDYMPVENRYLEVIPDLTIQMPMKNHPFKEEYFPVYNISKSSN